MESGAKRRLGVRPDAATGSDVDIEAWVRCSCETQGIPLKVVDAQALRDVAVLLRVGRDAEGAMPSR
jgi:hypothetical protein